MTDPLPATRRQAIAGIAATLAVPAFAQEKPAEPRFVLTAASTRHRFLPEPAAETETWGFGTGAAVPVLQIGHGEELFCRLVNRVTAPLTLHWAGMRGASGFDGVGGLTQPAVEPGAQFDYRFVPPDPGTFLVRSLVPGQAGSAGGRGLAAVLVVGEKAPPPVDAEHVLVVRDIRVEPDGLLSPFGAREEAALAGRLGNRLLVGDADIPRRIVARPGSRLRLRLVNACNARATRVRFDDLKVWVAAVDSQPAEPFEPLRASLPFLPGTRYDLFVDLPDRPGGKGTITALLGAGRAPRRDRHGRRADFPERSRCPAAASAQPCLADRDQAAERLPARHPHRGRGDAWGQRRAGVPAAGGPVWTLGGAAGAATAPPLFRVKRGQPVVLTLINATGLPQAIHLHGHVVRLLHGLDDGWEPYWVDTFQLAEGKVVRIAFVADAPGRWAITAAALERFDTGLWGWFEVT